VLPSVILVTLGGQPRDYRGPRQTIGFILISQGLHLARLSNNLVFCDNASPIEARCGYNDPRVWVSTT
jgi:hypothetical protein